MKENEEQIQKKKKKFMINLIDLLLTMTVLNVHMIKPIIQLCKEEVQMKDKQLYMIVLSAGINILLL